MSYYPWHFARSCCDQQKYQSKKHSENSAIPGEKREADDIDQPGRRCHPHEAFLFSFGLKLIELARKRCRRVVNRQYRVTGLQNDEVVVRG